MSNFGKLNLSSKSSLLSLLIVILLLLAGCAPPAHEVKDIYWPKPPDTPRVRYEGSFSSLKDFALTRYQRLSLSWLKF